MILYILIFLTMFTLGVNVGFWWGMLVEAKNPDSSIFNPKSKQTKTP